MIEPTTDKTPTRKGDLVVVEEVLRISVLEGPTRTAVTYRLGTVERATRAGTAVAYRPADGSSPRPLGESQRREVASKTKVNVLAVLVQTRHDPRRGVFTSFAEARAFVLPFARELQQPAST